MASDDPRDYVFEVDCLNDELFIEAMKRAICVCANAQGLIKAMGNLAEVMPEVNALKNSITQFQLWFMEDDDGE